MWPDLSGFRRKAKDGLKKAASGLEVEVPLKVDDDQAELELRRALLALNKIAKANPVTAVLKLDTSRAVSELRAKLAEMRRVGKLNPVEVPLHADEKATRDSLESLRRKIRELGGLNASVKFTPDTGAVSALKAKLSEAVKVKIHSEPVESDIEAVRAAFRNAFREVVARIHLDVPIAAVRAVRERINRALDNLRAKIHFDYDKSGLVKLQQLAVRTFDTKIKPKLDNPATWLVRAELANAFGNVEAKVKASLDGPSFAKARAEMGAAFKDIKVKIKAEVNKRSIAAAAQAFELLKVYSGYNLFRETIPTDLLKTLDQVAVKFATIASIVGGISVGAIDLVGNILAISAGLAQIAPAALAIPGIMVGWGTMLTATVVALKDINRQLPRLGDGFAHAGTIIRDKFWAEAKPAMSQLVDRWMPRIHKGMGEVATETGKFFSSLSSSLEGLLTSKLDGWFSSVARSTKIMSGSTLGLAKMVGAFGDLGEAYLPRVSTWLTKIVNQFGDWLSVSVDSGRAFGWVEVGIQRMKELWDVARGASRFLYELMDAANRADTSGLATLGKRLNDMADTLARPEVKRGLVDVFVAAERAMSNFATQAEHGIGAFLSNIARASKTLFPLIGEVVGRLVGGLGEILGHPAVSGGLENFFKNLNDAIKILASSFENLSIGLGGFVSLLGVFVKSAAPAVNSAISGMGKAGDGILKSLEVVAQNLGRALDDWVKALLPLINRVGPALGKALEDISGAIADLIQKVGPDFTEFADALGRFIADIAIPVVSEGLQVFLKFLEKVDWKALASKINNATDALDNFGKMIGDLSRGDWDSFMEHSKKASEAAIRANWLTAALSDAAKGIGDWLSRTAQAVGKWGAETADGIAKWGKDTADGIGKWISDTGRGLGDWFRSVGDTLSTWGESVGTWFSDMWANAVTAVQQALADIGTAIQTGMAGAAQTLTDAGALWDAAYRGVQTLISDAATAFWKSELGQTVTEGIGLVGDAITLGATAWKTFIENPLTELGMAVSTHWETIKASAELAWSEISTKINDAVEQVKSDLNDRWSEISENAKAWWSDLVQQASTYWEDLKTKITDKLGELKQQAEDAWNGVSRSASDIWGQIVAAVTGKAGEMYSQVTQWFSRLSQGIGIAWDFVKRSTGEAWNGLVRQVADGVTNAAREAGTLGSKALRELGNLGGVLVGAGRDLLDGFLRGIREKIAVVRSVLQDFTRSLPSWKGPAPLDRVLLTPAGRLVMQSFLDGLQDGMEDVRSYLLASTRELGTEMRGMAEQVGSGLEAPLSANLAATVDASASQGSGGDIYTFNLSVDLDDIEQVKDLKEWIEAMRRKARANGGSF